MNVSFSQSKNRAAERVGFPELTYCESVTFYLIPSVVINCNHQPSYQTEAKQVNPIEPEGIVKIPRGFR